MAIGNETGQMGNTLPLSGGGLLQQGSSAEVGLTITINSSVTSTAMNALRIQRAPAAGAGSTGGTEVFTVEYNGVRGLRQTRKLSSTVLSSADYNLPREYSGEFIIIPDMATSGSSNVIIRLPPVEQGLWFELYNEGTITTGTLQVLANSCGTAVVHNDSAADGLAFNKTTGVLGVGGSIRCHSDGTKWIMLTQPAFTSAAPTSATMTSFGVIT